MITICMFNIVRYCDTDFLKCLCHFTFPESFRFFAFLPKLGMIRLFNFNHFNRFVVADYYTTIVYIFLMINNVEYLCISLVVIHIFLFWNFCSICCPVFCFVVFVVVVRVLRVLYMLSITYICWFANIPFSSVTWLFIPLMVPLISKVVKFDAVLFINLVFIVDYLLLPYQRNFCLTKANIFSPMLSSRSIIILHLTSKIYFELIFMEYKVLIKVHFLPMYMQLLQHNLWKDDPFPQKCHCAFAKKINFNM